MAKNEKNKPTEQPVANNNSQYDLKTDAVDRLVNAENKEYPKLTLENDPSRKYRSGFIDRLPTWFKALFM